MALVEDLHKWSKKVTALAASCPWRRPGFPAIPDLFVFAGPPKIETAKAALKELATRTNPNTVVIYLLWNSDSVLEEKCQEEDIGTPVLFCSMKEGDFSFFDKILHAVSVLKPESINFAASLDVQLPEGFRDRVLSAIELMHINNKTARASRLLWLRCFLRNIAPILKQPSLKLPSVPSGTPAIICAAGPSLNTQIEIIRQNRERALLISVGHAAMNLAEAGISPDLVVDLDASAHVNYRRNYKFACPLATISTVSPQVPPLYNGVIWGQGASREANKFLEKNGVNLPRWNLSRSVTVTALDIASRMGCNPIALVGSDLALSVKGGRYAGENQAPPDDVISVEGIDGKPLNTTPNFAQLRKTIEDCLSSLPKTHPGLQVFNCTARGARIEHSTQKPLEDFYRDIQKTPAPLLFEQESAQPLETQGLPEKIESALSSYQDIIKGLLDITEELSREIRHGRPEMEKLQQLQANLRSTAQAENVAMNSPLLADLLRPMNEQIAEWRRESPQSFIPENDPLAQLQELHVQKSFIQKLCNDLLCDLRSAGKEQNCKAQYQYEALRQRSLEIIARNNPVFADTLKKIPGLDDSGESFSFSPIFQNMPPYVCMLRKGAPPFPLSAYETMVATAGKDISAFEKASGFSSLRHALVFLAPGNWVHPLLFASRHPDVPIMVAEPWLELLSTLIERGLFLHYLPENAFICGFGASSPEWKDESLRQLAKWKNEGREPLLFPHPLTWELPEIKGLIKEFRELL